jgi:hypothetical protein
MRLARVELGAAGRVARRRGRSPGVVAWFVLLPGAGWWAKVRLRIVFGVTSGAVGISTH